VKERAAADAAAARTEAEDRARTHKKRMLALMQRCQELEQNSASASATAITSSSTVSSAAAYTAGGPMSRRASAAVQNLCKPAAQLPDPAARNAAAPGWMSHNFD
jgi:hypothetical protein